MNHLNSILLEGVVSSELAIIGRGKAKRCSFALSSLHRDSVKKMKAETHIGVMVRDTVMVETAIAKARNGRGVRVVGRLANVEQGGGIYIEADHVEYRPEPGNKEE
jgi:hypothetical protein